MKKLILVGLVFYILLSCTGCSINYGKTNNVNITISVTEKFSKEEIEQSVNAVKFKFKSFEGCELTDLWYNEEKSNSLANDYLLYGGGLEKGIEISNVIVLLSNFKVDSSGGDGSFEPDSTYTDWSWILIRDDIGSNWKVDDWGY